MGITKSAGFRFYFQYNIKKRNFLLSYPGFDNDNPTMNKCEILEITGQDSNTQFWSTACTANELLETIEALSRFQQLKLTKYQ